MSTAAGCSGDRRPGNRRPGRWRAALLLLHAALGTWAIWAWRTGPFHGAALLDAADMQRLAVDGPGSFAPGASPLYPALLGLALRLAPTAGWVVGLLGVATSLVVLGGIGALCRRLGAPRAEPWAMALYVLSGSALGFIPQPLPVLLGAALLLWGSVLLLATHEAAAGDPAEGAPAPSRRQAVGGGALLGAGALTLAPLLLPAACVLVGLLRRRAALGVAALGAAVAVVLLGALVLPSGPWPAGLGLELRLGNGGARSGTTDLRPGPELDRLKLEPVVAAWEQGAPAVHADAHHLSRLSGELAEDPAGAAVTLVRKLYLFWQRTEIVRGADVRYGLQRMPLAGVLLWTFGLIAPLALAGLVLGVRGARRAAVWLPVIGVLLANVLALTSARDRFPALPFVCVAAGLWFAARPPRREWMSVAALGLLLNVDLAGIPLVQPGEGAVQEGELLLSQGIIDPAAVVLMPVAVSGRSPRAAFLLGLAIDREVSLHGDLSLREQAEAWYREALARQPLYPDAADALMRTLIAQDRSEEALSFGQAYVTRDPWAGNARLTMAAMLIQLGDKPRTLAMLVEGNRLLALSALAQHDRAAAQRGATELMRLAAPDPKLAALAGLAGS